MLLYVLLATFFFSLALAEKPLKTDVGGTLWCLCFIVLVLFDGLRWQTGTDWDSYMYFFRGCLNSQNDLDSLFERGYVAFNEAIRSITDKYSVLLILLALITYTGFFYFIRKFSPLPFLSLFLLFVNILPYQGMNRQFIAIVICLFSVQFLLRGQNWLFIFCVLFAMLFHTTAILFLLAFFLRKEYSLKFYCILMGSAALICLSGLMGKITSLSADMIGGAIGFRLAVYSSQELFESSLASKVLGLAMRAIFIIPVLYARYKKVPMSKTFIFFFNMYLMGTLIYCLFTGTILQVLVARGILYFSLFQIVLIPYILLLYRKTFSKTAMCAFLYVYFVFLMVRGIHNYDVGDYNPFLPYTTVASEFGVDVHKSTYYNGFQ